ncbi:hypothetical protein GCM10017782_29060 [Deinococcus ficus]|nr:hypothetical protein GCM10017782_29060 [Deinococcus ficus]
MTRRGRPLRVTVTGAAPGDRVWAPRRPLGLNLLVGTTAAWRLLWNGGPPGGGACRGGAGAGRAGGTVLGHLRLLSVWNGTRAAERRVGSP